MANATYKIEVGIKDVNSASRLNVTGAIFSLILFVGVLGWGAKMISRENLGVPVVLALDGPMRISPAEPGGVLASHQGLTVNEVPSSQNLVLLKNSLLLAPPAITLHAEDRPSSILALVAKSQRPSSFGSYFPIMDDTQNYHLDELSVENSDFSNISVTKKVSFIGSNSVTAFAGLAPKQPLRPRVRPLVIPVLLESKPTITPVKVILHGSPMAQLGAFGSKANALQAWTNLSLQHSNYLAGKKHIIMKAEVAGGTIYRLRVHGFSDLEDVRRLCSALNSQNAECYSVVKN